jgi:spore photoproduct lyase
MAAGSTPGLESKPVTVLKRGAFIKRFGGTPKGIVCQRFWQLAAAAGCPFKCSYCFLQATPSYVFGTYPLSGAIFENYPDMIRTIERWLEHPRPRTLVVGELQDGLAFDQAYRSLCGKTLTELLVPLFASQDRHKLVFLTKSVEVHQALRMKPTDRVSFAWSVNSDEAAERWEKGAPPPRSRLEAARLLRDKGWNIRIRIDPMIPHTGWREGYRSLCREVKELAPEVVTLGALRASPTLRAHAVRCGRDASVFDLLTGMDRAGYKRRLPAEKRLSLYRLAVDALAGSPSVLALCKEHRAVWNSLGLRFQGCNCTAVSAPGGVRADAERVQGLNGENASSP